MNQVELSEKLKQCIIEKPRLLVLQDEQAENCLPYEALPDCVTSLTDSSRNYPHRVYRCNDCQVYALTWQYTRFKVMYYSRDGGYVNMYQIGGKMSSCPYCGKRMRVEE